MSSGDMQIEQGFRLSKTLGVLAIMASAVTQEYGAGINFVAVQSLSVYPAIRDLVPLAMFVTGLLVLTKTYLYARFSQAMPSAGSAYVWIVRSLGLPIGFVANFIWWIGVTSAMGFLAFAFGTFLGQAFASAGWPIGAEIMTPTGHIVVGLLAIWLIFGIHASGVHQYGRFVMTLFVLILLVALTIVGIAFTTTQQTFLHLVSTRENLVLTAPASSEPFRLGAFFSVCSLFIFAYGGISAAPGLGGESRNARVSVPRGIIWAWLVAVVLFTTVSAALFHVAPWWAIIGLIKAGKSSLATAPGLISIVAPRTLSVTLNFVVALVVGKTLAPQMMCASRMAFAWGQDHMFSDRFVQTSNRRVPMAALLLSAGLASLFLLESAYVGWSLGVVVRSLSVILIWFLMAASALNLRFNPRFAQTPWSAPLKRDPWLMTAALASLVITVVLFRAAAISPHTPFVFQPLVQGVVLAIVGMVILASARRRAALTGENLGERVAAPPLE
ncbi:MAG: APC family permease [Burkholderiales bacterium]|nr:APC family permease [Burkholderiales bacterium]